MLDSQELKRLADRCYSASQKCFDLSAAAELRIIGDELSAKATELERQSRQQVPWPWTATLARCIGSTDAVQGARQENGRD